MSLQELTELQQLVGDSEMKALAQEEEQECQREVERLEVMLCMVRA